MTDRERHLKVLEEFYRHHYQYDCGDYSGIGDDVAKAIQYAINSIKTDLKYEGEDPTTKNDLEVASLFAEFKEKLSKWLFHNGESVCGNNMIDIDYLEGHIDEMLYEMGIIGEVEE